MMTDSRMFLIGLLVIRGQLRVSFARFADTQAAYRRSTATRDETGRGRTRYGHCVIQFAYVQEGTII